MTIIEKLYAGKDLREDELRQLVWLEFEEADKYDIEKIDVIEGDDHRWTREMSTIIKIDDDYWRINWMAGLTECQENEYYNQPYKVNPVKKTIVVTEWERVNESDNH